MSDTKSRGTVNIDPDVLKFAKVYAAENGTTVKDLVETALLAWLSRWPKTGMVPTHTARRLSARARRLPPTTSGSPRSESAPPRKPK